MIALIPQIIYIRLPMSLDTSEVFAVNQRNQRNHIISDFF